MMNRLKILPALLIFLPVALFTQKEAVPEAVVNAFSRGDASALSQFFNNRLELVILDKEDVYSKVQAEMIIKSFFTENKPEGFRIIHQGGRADAKYAIGLYRSSGKVFRIYLLLKPVDNQPKIHQLRIEKENGSS